MSDELVCPKCGGEEHLTGQPHGELIRITCRACNLVWDRDPSPSCRRCGSSDAHPVPKPIIQKARGTQLSIVGHQTIYLCRLCQAADAAEYRHIPPDENPAADMG